MLFIVNGLDHGPGPAVADRPIASELKEIREWKSMGLEAFLWRFGQQVSYENYFISLHFDNVQM